MEKEYQSLLNYILWIKAIVRRRRKNENSSRKNVIVGTGSSMTTTSYFKDKDIAIEKKEKALNDRRSHTKTDDNSYQYNVLQWQIRLYVFIKK